MQKEKTAPSSSFSSADYTLFIWKNVKRRRRKHRHTLPGDRMLLIKVPFYILLPDNSCISFLSLTCFHSFLTLILFMFSHTNIHILNFTASTVLCVWLWSWNITGLHNVSHNTLCGAETFKLFSFLFHFSLIKSKILNICLCSMLFHAEPVNRLSDFCFINDGTMLA